MKSDIQFIAIPKNGDSKLELVMAKKVLENNKVFLVACGDNSEFYACYKIDDWQESVEEYIEEYVDMIGDNSPYEEHYSQLMSYINHLCEFDFDGIPFLARESRSSKYMQPDGSLVINWYWDDNVHVVASHAWGINKQW